MADRPAELLRLAREGDLDAFGEFVRLYERRVRALVGRLLDDERDVEEATQDTFVQAWRTLARFRGEAAPFTWLYRIAVNEALQRARRKQLDVRPLEDEAAAGERVPVAPVELPEEAAENIEARRFLAARLRELPLELRAPIVLRDVQGWSNREVAEALGLSIPAAKTRIHRARMRLRQELALWREERRR